MELTIFESPDREWNEFASQYTDLIFYQSVWAEVLKKGLGGQPLYFCLRGEVEALAWTDAKSFFPLFMNTLK